MEEGEKKALEYLPRRLRDSVLTLHSLNGGRINEIRLRENRALSITSGKKNIVSDITVTREEVEETLLLLCDGSVYSASDGLREGVVTTRCGIRAGVAGVAVMLDGELKRVRDISSVSIRIPHRAAGAADKLYEYVKEYGSVVIYSPPGFGKTTLLRELIPLLTTPPHAYRVSVIDTRYELTSGISESPTADILYGYPRKSGIMSAVRTLSPEYIICDELSDIDEVSAVLEARMSGVNVIATAHASSYRELISRPALKPIAESGTVKCFYGIMRDGAFTVDTV